MTKGVQEIREAPMSIVLLPGLDGTGDLFAPLVDSAPPGLAPQVLGLAGLQARSYPEYADLLEPRLPAEEPFVLLGESFSGPLAILLVARWPPGLRALVLCNSFVVAPAWPRVSSAPLAKLAVDPRSGMGTAKMDGGAGFRDFVAESCAQL